MIQMESLLPVADNTGARTAKCIKVLGQRKTVAGMATSSAFRSAKRSRRAWSRRATRPSR